MKTAFALLPLVYGSILLAGCDVADSEELDESNSATSVESSGTDDIDTIEDGEDGQELEASEGAEVQEGEDGDLTTSECGELIAADLAPESDSARYCVTFSAQWREAGFGPVPGPAHFTTLIGAAVNEESQLWAADNSASPGFEKVAEAGTVALFTEEIELEIEGETALEVVSVKGTGAVEERHYELELTQNFPLYTFATMIAPSPDWFVGLSQFSLKNEAGNWLDAVSLELPAYDAGTESGEFFSLAGTATEPAQVISRLNASISASIVFSDGRVDESSIASIRFQRIR